MAAERIHARAVDGTVVIECMPADARDLAEAFSTAYATCDEVEAERPRWFDDVIAIVTAAARADEQAGNAPTLRTPVLQLVAGGEAQC